MTNKVIVITKMAAMETKLFLQKLRNPEVAIRLRLVSIIELENIRARGVIAHHTTTVHGDHALFNGVDHTLVVGR